MSQVPLRGRGRPARFISELTSMSLGDHQNNSNHSDITPVSSSAFTMTSQSILTDPSTLLGDSPDDHSLSIAVEMAAVNQAIIALSGQTPINIHNTEKNGHHNNNNNNTSMSNNNHREDKEEQSPEPLHHNGKYHKPTESNNNHPEQEDAAHSPTMTAASHDDSNSSTNSNGTAMVVQPLGEIVFPSVTATS